MLASAVCLALLTTGCGPTGESPPADHVVLISIDGLLPEYIRDPGAYGLELPAISRLRVAGSHADAVIGQYPSDTYPSHASIVTGVTPALHGIDANRILGPDGDQSTWFRETSHFRSPPIWRVAKEYGLTTAAVIWPVTLGADIDYLLPETGPPPPGRPWPSHLPTVSSQGLAEFVFTKMGIGLNTPITPQLVDAFATEAAAHIIATHKPSLLLVHLFATDSAQHVGGRHSVESLDAFRAVDEHIERIVTAVHDAGIGERTTVVITGDHGFSNVEGAVRPNVLLRRAGLIETDRAGNIVSWRAIAHGGAIVTAQLNDTEAATAARMALSDGSEVRFASWSGQSWTRSVQTRGPYSSWNPPRAMRWMSAGRARPSSSRPPAAEHTAFCRHNVGCRPGSYSPGRGFGREARSEPYGRSTSLPLSPICSVSKCPASRERSWRAHSETAEVL